MIPRPTATSQAATTMTMIAKIWPSPLPFMRENAISARLPALSISSRQSRITSGLRRTSTPAAPTQKISAETTRYQAMVTSRPALPSPPGRGRSTRPGCRTRDAHDLGGRQLEAGARRQRLVGRVEAARGGGPGRRRRRRRRAAGSEAISNGNRNLVSSSWPICPGVPKPGPSLAPVGVDRVQARSPGWRSRARRTGRCAKHQADAPQPGPPTLRQRLALPPT